MGNKKREKKLIFISAVTILLSILLSICSPFMNKVYAAQRKELYNGSNLDTNKYPGYVELLNSLRQRHPKWKFTLLYTGLDWNSTLDNEYTGHGRSPLNLIPYNKGAGWRCTICGDKVYDNGNWCCASRNAIAYQIDPRNSLNDNDIFQFEDARFIEGVQTVKGIISKTNNTFLRGESVANALLTAGRNNNLNPYYVVSRLIQEQGPSGTTLSKGYNYNGVTVYNPFNIGASGNSSSQIIQNGAKYAYEHGWTSLETGILGGMSFINEKYMNRGQVSAFLQKFDVVDQDGSIYSNQYMQNLQAPQYEGVSTRRQYEASATKESNINFVIPLFENMPRYNTTTGGAPRPSDSASNAIITINMKTNCKVNMRSTPNATSTSNKINSIENGTTVLAIEEGVPGKKIVNGQVIDTTFNKVVLDNGTYGYIVASALDQVDDVVTCNETLMVNTTTELRNGPGTEHTTVVTTLPVGQVITRIDKGRYYLNGISWDRVILANGQQGFVNTKALGEQENLDIVEVNANPSLRLREGPGTEYTQISSILDGTRIVRLEKATNPSSDGAYWDKVITPEGVIGYVSREFLIEITNPTPKPEPIPPVETAGMKIEGNKFLVEPKTKVSHIKDAGYEVISVTKDGQMVGDNDNLATGTTLVTKTGTYTVVKLGDINGDGLISPIDYVQIKNHITNTTILNEDYRQRAANVNNDGEISPMDYVRVKNYITLGNAITLE